MVQCVPSQLDAAFAALSDATRRGILQQLARKDASISALAEGFGMTLTGMKKHVGILEHAGFVRTEKVGRVRQCRLGPHDFAAELAWIAEQRRLWAARFDALEQIVEDLAAREKTDGPE
jgi:DNA-binding transcriptional ArsR family regulator